MGGTHCPIQRQQMDKKSDRVDTTRMDKMAEKTRTRWRDNLIRHMGPAWPRLARDRRLWKQFREGFLLTEGVKETLVVNVRPRVN